MGVAVIDTGIDYTHPDLAANYAGGYDFVNDDYDPLDDNGHGTHVAGTVAACDDGPNSGGADTTGISVVGVGPHISLVTLKVLSAQGTGSTSDVVAALNVATALRLACRQHELRLDRFQQDAAIRLQPGRLGWGRAGRRRGQRGRALAERPRPLHQRDLRRGHRFARPPCHLQQYEQQSDPVPRRAWASSLLSRPTP